jgi:hypothetical protein
MVVALLLLSLAMIVGGALSAAFGWDIVLNERGWVMVIAGATVATGGALVLALAALAARLGRIRGELAEIRDRAGRAEPALPSAPALDPVAAIASGLLAGAAEPGRPPEGGDAALRLPAFLQPEPPPAPPPETAPPAVPTEPERGTGEPLRPAEPVPEPGLSGPLFDDLAAPERSPGRDDARPAAPADEAAERESLAAPPEAGPEERPDEAAAAEPADTVPPDEPAAAAEPEPELAAAPGRAVIGTYTSGSNRYVMFGDGSIEAETPDGTFRFASLDELKEFIAAGGEDRPDGAGPA